jgi:hypothetical protein
MRALLGKPAMPLPLVADSKLLPSASAASSQHRAAVLGGHAGEKAMRFGALSVIRLKSTFRHLDYPARRACSRERPFELKYLIL